ncbi:hypothetical protein [Companilactobacillus mishanensis]|uniref:SAM-dependent methyltransferase n=1 Tax=Companilactobacillus mishanensis TaxID=2486008 RepID=A0ABW9P4Y0_9LACO|nr:hypothetical protein [Companilactobacillus mishanensis]MQS44305.1 hypothetical protein [Companilactobacillus mishanensis]
MDYIENLRQIVSTLPQPKVFTARINFMQHVCDALKSGNLPKYRFPTFELSESEIKNYLRSNMTDDESKFQQMVETLQNFDKQLGEFRTYLQVRFGYWATITDNLMDSWVKLFPDRKYLELMAGNGYISKGLRNRNMSVVCTDNLSWSAQSKTGETLITDIEQLDALSAIKKYHDQVDSVVLAWSPDRDEIDFEILKEIRKFNLEFFVIGEEYGATNSKKFWDSINVIKNPEIDELNQVYSQYDLVNDKIFLIQ